MDPSTDFEALFSKAASVAKAEEEQARKTHERARQALSVWSELQTYHSKGWDAHVVALFRREARFFHELRAANDSRIDALESLYRASEQHAKEAISRFPADFERACLTAGIDLDQTSRHPHYTIRGFIEVDVNEFAIRAVVKPRDGARGEIPLDIPALIEYLSAQQKRLFERSWDPKPFLTRLFTAYQAALKEDRRPPGDDLPIRRVIHRLSKNMAFFALDEFNVDLARAIREGAPQVKEHSLHLGHTRNTRQGMLLQGLEDTGYVGFIAFRKG